MNDRRLATWLSEGPERGPDDGLERVLAVVGRTRQRPGFVVTDRWLDAWAGGLSPWTWRAALAFVALAILAAVLVGVASRKPSAEELVRLSQAAHQDPPPFTMTTTTIAGPAGGIGCPVRLDEGDDQATTFRFLYDGGRSFREECHYGGRLSELSVTDGSAAGRWLNGAWSASTGPRVGIAGGELPSGAPAATVPWLNWIQVGDLDEPDRVPGRLVSCSEWMLGEAAVVAGRQATEVACGRAHYWVDDASRLLVAFELENRYRIDALSLEVGDEPTSALFIVRPPTGVRVALNEGRTPPDWTLPLVGGGSLDWSSLRGRPVAVLVHSSVCALDCIDLESFAATLGVRDSEIHAIAIGDRFEFPSAGLEAARRANVPVVEDDASEVSGWIYPPGVSLFDAAGRYRLTVGPLSGESLSAAVDAFVNEMPIPPVPPGDGTFAVGRPAPAFVTTTLEGAAFDISSLRGKPVVVLAPAWESDADIERREATRALVTAIGSAHELVGQRATFVVIAWETGYTGPPPAGWADVLASARAAAGPSFDDVIVVIGETYAGRDGWTAIAWVGGGFPARWDASIVVLDAEGTVARLLGEPLPSAQQLARIVAEVEAER